MKILFTGSYNPSYNRNLILEKGLKTLGHQVFQYPFSKWSNKVKGELRSKQKEADLVYMPSFSHKHVAAVSNTISKALVFDPLISRYMTYVLDYKKYPRYSWGALRNFLRDKRALSHANLVLADTAAHKKYFSETFGIDEKNIEVLPIGVDTDIFFPAPKSEDAAKDVFHVGYVGGYIPLHGIEHLTHACHLLQDEKDVQFSFVGKGHDFAKFIRLKNSLHIDNIKVIDWVKPEQLRDYIRNFDLCLGVFGDSIKTDIVIPNKVYEYSGMKRSTLTKDCKGIREVFADNKDIFLCSNQPQDIAGRILEIKSNSELNTRVAGNAFDSMKNSYSEIHIAERFLNIVNKSNLIR